MTLLVLYDTFDVSSVRVACRCLDLLTADDRRAELRPLVGTRAAALAGGRAAILVLGPLQGGRAEHAYRRLRALRPALGRMRTLVLFTDPGSGAGSHPAQLARLVAATRWRPEAAVAVPGGAAAAPDAPFDQTVRPRHAGLDAPDLAARRVRRYHSGVALNRLLRGWPAGTGEARGEGCDARG